MVTAAHQRRLLKPLLARHPKLMAGKRWLILTPVQHLVGAITLESVSFDPRGRPRWAVVPLFEPSRSLHLSYGSHLVYHLPPDQVDAYRASRSWDDTIYAEWLADAYGTYCLPLMRRLTQDLDAFLSFNDEPYSSVKIRYSPVDEFIFRTAMGHFDRARELAERTRNTWHLDSHRDDSFRRRHRLCVEIDSYLAADDLTGLATVLHRTEAEQARIFGIESAYEPKPFPFQQTPAATKFTVA